MEKPCTSENFPCKAFRPQKPCMENFPTCKAFPTFESENGSFVVSFAAPPFSVRTVRSIQIFPVGSIQICDKFVTKFPGNRKQTLRTGSPEMFGKEISRWFWDLDHHGEIASRKKIPTLRTGLTHSNFSRKTIRPIQGKVTAGFFDTKVQ